MKKSSRITFTIIASIAFVIAAAVILFFAYTLYLRTLYKEAALEINDAILAADDITLSRGGESFPASSAAADFYNKFLLNKHTVVYSRKEVPATDQTIILRIDENALSFTGIDDGTAIAVKWKTAQEEQNYIVRSQTTFMQLKAYYDNYKRKAKE